MAGNTAHSPTQGNESPTTEKLARLLIAVDGVSAMLYCAANKIGEGSDSPDRIGGIAQMLADIAIQLDEIANTLAAATEGRSNG
ncbi:hypothetical protein ABZN20_10310 [Methylococcus sp. ANG]|uniref:hypothetical protein n=1 Tax=Methylococcus sp. ANG TaxID=3231903 RepID=UPI003457C839